MRYKYIKEELEKAVEKAYSLKDLLRILHIKDVGSNYKTVKNKLELYKIDYSHFNGNVLRSRSGENKYKDASNYLYKGSTITTFKLKEKLIRDGLKENKCECCGIDMWNNKPIVLQLHHIDGDHTNNELENLQLLCPNCHSQTDSYCGAALKKKRYYCQRCGEEIGNKSTYCMRCNGFNHRKVERPSKEELINDLKELRVILKIASKYNVSDKAIYKWCKSYDMPDKKDKLLEFADNYELPL